MAHVEALGEELTQAPHSEGLSGVVAGRDEVHAGLARLRHHALGGLACQEGVGPGGDRVREVVGAGPRDDSQTAD